MMLGVIIILAVLMVSAPLIGLALSEQPWLFERPTPEQKLLLEMLAEIASDGDWERAPAGFGLREFRHAASGVRFANGYIVDLNIGETRVRFEHNSRGYRLCQRIVKAVEYREKWDSDLRALKGMTQAFDRMGKIN